MRYTKIAAPVAAVVMAFGGASIAVADPGPNGHNTFGLCTAYFAGSEKGQEMKRQAPPFQGLEAAAAAANQSVETYCEENGSQPGNGGKS